MSLKITFLGHAGFLLEDGKHALAIDPFLTGNEYAVHSARDMKCDTLVITHGHFDHIADAVEIASGNAATLIAPMETANYLVDQANQRQTPIEKVEHLGPGGQLDTDFGYVAFTQAIHPSSYEGGYMGIACGVVIHMGGATFYHLGDTTVFSDLKLLADIYKPDIGAFPVGDRYTMGPKLATIAAEMVNPKIAIPIHYKTFPALKQTAEGFAPKGVKVMELQPGQVLEYE